MTDMIHTLLKKVLQPYCDVLNRFDDDDWADLTGKLTEFFNIDDDTRLVEFTNEIILPVVPSLEPYLSSEIIKHLQGDDQTIRLAFDVITQRCATEDHLLAAIYIIDRTFTKFVEK